jgi:hypothetical protein
MKKVLLILALVTVFFSVSVCYAGTLNFGVAKMNGHSNDSNRCINSGISADLGYDWTVGEYNFFKDHKLLKLLGVSLDAGGLFTYSNYETAHRETAKSDETDHRHESSWTLAGVAKPTFHIWSIYVYKMWGVGTDYAQTGGLDYGWLEGKGLGFDITDNVSIDVSKRKVYRHDTGNTKHTTLAIRITF